MLARRAFLGNADPHQQGGNVSDRGGRRGRETHGPAYHQWTARGRPAPIVMTVNLTRIYTRLGDGGETHLGDMSRVSKLDPRVQAYGTVAELHAGSGVALLGPGRPGALAEWMRRVPDDLLDLCADRPAQRSRAADGAEEAP